jgi:hypothetical protein
LPYEAYAAKFAKAGEELAAYDRKLARTIGSVIEFHFNHFQDSARLCPESRVAHAAGRYARWLNRARGSAEESSLADEQAARLEELITDWATEQIVRWSIRPLVDLQTCIEEVELFLLKRDLAEFDRVKLHILLAEFHGRFGDAKRGAAHAKALRNLAITERWAETMIRSIGKLQ